MTVAVSYGTISLLRYHFITVKQQLTKQRFSKEEGFIMKKKFLFLVAAMLILTMGLITGCGSSDEETADDGSWKYIEDNGELIVGLDDTFAPMGFRDKNDNLIGFDIDLANAVGEELGVKVNFKPIDWDAKEMELESKTIDCIWNGMSATEERQESMSLSKKYLNNKIVIMTMKKDINVGDVADLKDLKIGTQADSAALETMQANEDFDSFKDNITEYKSYDTAMLDMKAGRIDCVVIDQVLGNYKSAKGKDKLYTSDYDFGDDFYAIGFRKGETTLTDKVNEALQTLIDNGKAAEISEKWFGKDIVILEDYK